MRVELWRKLSAKELMLLKCGVGEDSWTVRRLNQSILYEINLEYSLEGLMLNEAPIFWPHEVKNRLIGKDPDTGED